MSECEYLIVDMSFTNNESGFFIAFAPINSMTRSVPSLFDILVTNE